MFYKKVTVQNIQVYQVEPAVEEPVVEEHRELHTKKSKNCYFDASQLKKYTC